MEQFDDILRTFINETQWFENRFGKIRDEGKILAVKKLMLESLLNFTFRGRTLKYEKFSVALENIILDNFSTVPTTRQKQVDTSAPMDIGMATKDDSEVREKRGTSESWASHCKLAGSQKSTQVTKLTRMQIVEEGVHDRKAMARKEAQVQRMVARATAGHAGDVATQDES